MVSEFEEDVTKRVPAERRGVRVASAELVVVEGPDRGRRVAIKDGQAKVGTAPGTDLTLADPTVSRLHCEIKVRGAAFLLRDLGSTNGTRVEGVRIKEGEVGGGALVHVGATAFRIELGDEAVFLPVSERASFGELVGESLEMRRLYAVLERVAPTDSTLLIQGETGTGKDVAARAVHAASRRRSGPFVPVDCGAIPESLFESELFGHLRGAFSGATGDRIGVLEEANGGTLFLDEIGELPLALQPKLLRAIETKSVRPIGANTARPIDVRIIAATHRPLARAVNDGSFREDLYYRLAVVELVLPPLRARKEDIPPLATHFYRRLTETSADLPGPLLDRLAERSWPGNVRELRNHIERGVTLGLFELHDPTASAPPRTLLEEGSGLPAALESLVPLELPLKEARERWTEAFEQIYVRSMLAATGGNLTRAAERAGVSRRFLQRLVARLGLRASED